MVINIFRFALRNVLKNKVFAFLNIIGLAVGLTASLLILLWIQDELSYEKYNLNAENIYRVEEDQFYSGERYHVTETPHPSGPVWKEKIPEIREQTRINRLPRILFRQDDKVFYESSVIAADSGLFKVFTMQFVIGDPETALNSPHSIVLTEKLAAKYFGDANPIGKTFTLENKFQFMITGVMKDLPGSSMFTFEGVIPYSFLSEIGAISNSWGNNSILTFLKCEKGIKIDSVNKKLTDVVRGYLQETTTKYLLFPLLDIHLHSQFGYEISKGPVIVIFIFTLIAVFVLLIACLGLYGLSAYSTERKTNEIGTRKVMGAGTMTILYSMVKEFLLLVLISLVIALPAGWIIVTNLLKQFANRIEINISVFAIIAAGTIVIALATVVFQAFKASLINPAISLKVE
jgi:putative ABC transport system permease protein